MSNWIEFWDKEKMISAKLWRQSNESFFYKTLNLWSYDKNDIILDIGCGKGYFAEFIVDKVKEIHLVDTSSNCLDVCKRKFNSHENIFYHLLPKNDYTNIKFHNIKATKIICSSVIQYYKNFKEVEDLILSCKKISNNGKLLISDIPIQSNRVFDMFIVLYDSIISKTFFQTLRFLLKARFGEYNKIRNTSGITIYSENQFLIFLKKMDLQFKVYHRLTNLKNRINILIELK